VAETASFGNPIFAEPGASQMRLASLTLQVFPDPVVKIILAQWQNGAFVPNGKRLSVFYTGAQAATMLGQLNTANFSTVSLRERVMERLVADGRLTDCTLV
jgi:hypothetical protein